MGPIYRLPNGKVSVAVSGEAFTICVGGEDCGGEDCGGEELLEKRGGEETVDMAEAWRERLSVARGRGPND